MVFPGNKYFINAIPRNFYITLFLATPESSDSKRPPIVGLLRTFFF